MDPRDGQWQGRMTEFPNIGDDSLRRQRPAQSTILHPVLGAVIDFDVRRMAKRTMARRRYQRGTLRTSVPGNGARKRRNLPRGDYWAQWYQYVKQQNGREKRRRREKIITRDLAERYGIAKDYTGPLTKIDAQRVLDILIAEESGTYVRPDAAATVEQLAREYLALSEPNWGPRMVQSAGSIVRHRIIGELGERAIADVTKIELQSWLNRCVNAGDSRSMLRALLLHIRGIWKHAREREITVKNPTEDLRAKSKKRVCERSLSADECRRLLAVLSGRDRLIVRMFIQLGLRPEEMFALRREDMQGDQLRIDEALVYGQPAPTKTGASDAYVYLPPDLAEELRAWLDCSSGEPTDWLFQTQHGRRGFLNANNYRNRVLKPAAIRAKVGVFETGKRDQHGRLVLGTDVDFRSLRRTCATLFGAIAKDPKSTQAQLRHADPTITLKHYQKAVPASVKAAAIALELELRFKNTEQELNRQEIQ